MISAAVLAFQAAIFLSIVYAASRGKRWLYLATFLWVAETAVAISMGWLMALQFITIFFSFQTGIVRTPNETARSFNIEHMPKKHQVVSNPDLKFSSTAGGRLISFAIVVAVVLFIVIQSTREPGQQRPKPSNATELGSATPIKSRKSTDLPSKLATKLDSGEYVPLWKVVAIPSFRIELSKERSGKIVREIMIKIAVKRDTQADYLEKNKSALWNSLFPIINEHGISVTSMSGQSLLEKEATMRVQQFLLAASISGEVVVHLINIGVPLIRRCCDSKGQVAYVEMSEVVENRLVSSSDEEVAPPFEESADVQPFTDCHVGPRGGTYTVNSGGTRNYRGC